MNLVAVIAGEMKGRLISDLFTGFEDHTVLTLILDGDKIFEANLGQMFEEDRKLKGMYTLSDLDNCTLYNQECEQLDEIQEAIDEVFNTLMVAINAAKFEDVKVAGENALQEMMARK